MSDVLTSRYRIGPDAKNANCRRVHEQGRQICKVYGWSSEEAQALAERIVAALIAADQSSEAPSKPMAP